MRAAKTFREVAAPASWWKGWGRPTVRTEAAPPCAVCGKNEFAVKAEGFDYEMGTCPNRWTYQACCECGHIQLNPRPIAQELPVIYPADYYSYDMAKKVSPWVLRCKGVLDDLRLRSILKQLARSPTSYLDVGCGDGKYLDRMKARGLSPGNIYGIELDAEAVKQSAARGYRVFHQPVEQCEGIAANSIDVITLFHVIEHLADPGACVDKLSSWLAPGGILAIETPNSDSIDARWFSRTYWGGYHIPRHWHVFSDAGLVRLLERHGLEVVTRRFVSGHSFWLYSFHHWLAFNTRLPLPRLARWFDPLRSRVALIFVTGFDYLRAAIGFKTSSVLVMARKK